MKPLVSIVTVNFNGEKFLEETIECVLNQTYSNVEYIIIDGKSKDGSLDIIRKYEDQIAYWVSEPDKGMYDGINKGFAKATGEIYAYINSDDLYFPDTIERVVEEYQKKPFDLLYGHTELIDKDSKVLYRLKAPPMNRQQIIDLQRLPFNQQSCFWSAEGFKKIGGFDSNLKLAADTKFFFHFIVDEKFKVQRSDSFIGKFRLHDETLSANYVSEMAGELVLLLKQHNIYSESTLGSVKRLSNELIFKMYNFKKYIHFNLLKQPAE